MHARPIHPAVRVGHMHLRVADLDRAIHFYPDILGFNLTADGHPAGIEAAFLSAGDYHHRLGLNTWESAGSTPPPLGHTGLYHVAVLYPDRRELGHAVKRLLDHGHPVDHGHPIDHGASVSVYLDDNRIVTDELLPALEAEPGYAGAIRLANPTSGDGVMIVLWQTAEQAHRPLADYVTAFPKALAQIAAISTGTRRPISVWTVNA